MLGTFILTIVYLLLVLRSVQGDWSNEEVPHAAVTRCSLLALVSVLAVLAFIQGVATSMVADEVVLRVRKEFDAAVKELPPLRTQGMSSAVPRSRKTLRRRPSGSGFLAKVTSSPLSTTNWWNGPARTMFR